MFRDVLERNLNDFITASISAACGVLHHYTGPIREAMLYFKNEVLQFVDVVYKLPLTLSRCPPPTYTRWTIDPQDPLCRVINDYYEVQPVPSYAEIWYEYLDWVVLAIFFLCLSHCLRSTVTYWYHNYLAVRIRLYVSHLAETPPTNPASVRSIIDKLSPMPQRLSKVNAHPKEGAHRNAALHSTEVVAQELGLKTYHYQYSNANAKRNCDGLRVHYWTKDAAVHPRLVDVTQDHMPVLVDVDQYLDMHAFLNNNPFNPVAIYTLQPKTVARNDLEYSFTFDRNNNCHNSIQGGAKFVQKIWNYQEDNIYTWTASYNAGFRARSYNVVRKRISNDRELVYLVPVAEWSGLLNLLLFHLFYEGQALGRYVVYDAATGMNILRVQGDDGLAISIADPGSYNATSALANELDNLHTVAQLSSLPITAAQAKQHLASSNPADVIAAVKYVRSAKLAAKPTVTTAFPPRNVVPTNESVRQYTVDTNTDHTEKKTLTPFMQPFVHECYTTARTKADESYGLSERVTKIAVPELPLTPFLVQVIGEFAEHLIPVAHVLHPTPYDEVWERQNRPTQRRLITAAEFDISAKPITTTFIKAEAYPEPKPARNISTIPTLTKITYSQYVYALTEGVLYQQDWYAFGRNPDDIATRVAEICQRSDEIALTDFSRFDGRVSNVLRHVEKTVLMRAFHTSYHEDLIELHDKQYNCKGFAAQGTVYQTLYSRLSGSPETAAANSIDNAFVAYLEKRLARSDGVQHTPLAAWKTLGIYGGDDGLSSGVDKDCLMRAARMVGASIKYDAVRRGETGITFLARKYSPDVWHGARDNMLDLPRQLSKFHATPNLPSNVTPFDKLVQKTMSFGFTDRDTPGILEYVTLVDYVARRKKHLMVPPPESPLHTLTSWAAWFGTTNQYRQNCDTGIEWMMDEWRDTIGASALDTLLAWIRELWARREEMTDAELEQAVLCPPLLKDIVAAPAMEVPIVVDGDVTPGTKFKSYKDALVSSPADSKRSTTPPQRTAPAASSGPAKTAQRQKNVQPNDHQRLKQRATKTSRKTSPAKPTERKRRPGPSKTKTK